MALALTAQLLTGFLSPVIFVPGFAIGWFARRWWQVIAGAAAVAAMSLAWFFAIDLPPGAEFDWSSEPLSWIPPVAWCTAGFMARAWYRHMTVLRAPGPLRRLPIVSGMLLGAIGGVAAGFGIGLVYIATDVVTATEGMSVDEAVFFYYLVPGLLIGQLSGGLIGRVLGRPSKT